MGNVSQYVFKLYTTYHSENWHTYSVEYKNETDYASEGKVRLLLGQNVKDMDAYRKAALLEDGRIVFYEKALLATGGEPRLLPGAPKHPHVTTFRTVSATTNMLNIYYTL